MILKSNTGFSMIDVMIAVSIMAILAAVAAPNVDCFVDTAHRSEARIALSAIYQAEQSHKAEFNTYTSCIMKIGFNPEPGKRIYTVGMGAQAVTNQCGTGTDNCAVYENAHTCNAVDANFGDPISASDINVAANTLSGTYTTPMSFANMGSFNVGCRVYSVMPMGTDPTASCWGQARKDKFIAVAYRGLTDGATKSIDGYFIDHNKTLSKVLHP